MDMLGPRINGSQLVYGPPKDFTKLEPTDSEVYINNIPRNMSIIDLFNIFREVGPIYKVRIPFFKCKRGHARYGFVRYMNEEDASLAILSFHHHSMFVVNKSHDNRTLYLGGIPKNVNCEDIKSALSRHVDGISMVLVFPSRQHPGTFRGFCFVKFVTHTAASKAIRILNRELIYDLWGSRASILWAKPEATVPEYIMRKVTTLFLRNIPECISQVHIRKYFTDIIGSRNIKTIRLMFGFAYVNFIDRATAKTALDHLRCHPLVLNGFTVEVQWAKPLGYTEDNQNESRHFQEKLTCNIAYLQERNRTCQQMQIRKHTKMGTQDLGVVGTVKDNNHNHVIDQTLASTDQPYCQMVQQVNVPPFNQPFIPAFQQPYFQNYNNVVWYPFNPPFFAHQFFIQGANHSYTTTFDQSYFEAYDESQTYDYTSYQAVNESYTESFDHVHYQGVNVEPYDVD